MIAPADPTQSAWDQETAAAIRQRLRRLAGQVRERQQEEDEARDAYRAAKEASKKAAAALSRAIEAEGISDTDYAKGLRTCVQLAGRAADAEADARRKWRHAVTRRQAAAQTLRETAARQVEDLPLFDDWGRRSAAPSGNLAAEVQVETAKEPVIEKDLESILESEAECDERERREWEEKARRTPGDRLSLVSLDQVPRMRPEYALELAKRNLKTVGDVVTFINRHGQPFDLWLKDTCHFRLNAAIDLLCCLTDWLEANPPPAPEHERRCSKCGCVQDECGACILRAGHACEWAVPLEGDKDICTVCVQEQGEEEAVLPEEEEAATEPALPGFETETVKEGKRKRMVLKGEPILPLGVTPDQLTASYIGALFSDGQAHGKPVQVKPVTLSLRPWVCWAIASNDQGHAWKMLPLYTPEQYAQRFGPEAVGLTPALFNRQDSYHGITVAVGRKTKYIIGPESEGRTLVDQ